MKHLLLRSLFVFGVSAAAAPALAQAVPAAPPAQNPPAAPAAAEQQNLPAGYVIGADDVLNIVFWREPDMSAEVVVRPDGRISLPLLNEVDAIGQTPSELRATLTARAAKFVAEPNVAVVVKQINSRKVFITGMVARPGAYALGAGMTVLQLVAMSGGLLEYADSEQIVIMRTDGGKPSALGFNYKDVTRRRNLHQNVELAPGDTVIVP